MGWKLVGIFVYYRYMKQIHLTGCFIALFILIFLYNYIGYNYRTYDNNVLVTSDKVLGNYEVGNSYYPYFDDIKTNFQGKDIIVNMSFSNEEEIDDLFEVIVPFAYRDLLNKEITISINDIDYRFFVIGVCRDKYKEDYFMTNTKTLSVIYDNSFDLERYTYRFIVDDYKSLNESLDVLTLEGYDMSIRPNKTLANLTNYDSGRDLIILFIAFFIFVIWVVCL